MKKYEDQRRARLPDFRKKSKKITSAVKEKSGSEKLNDLMFEKPHQVSSCRKNSSNEIIYIKDQLNRSKQKTAKERRKKGKRVRHSDESSDEESSVARKPRKKRKKIPVHNQPVILPESDEETTSAVSKTVENHLYKRPIEIEISDDETAQKPRKPKKKRKTFTDLMKYSHAKQYAENDENFNFETEKSEKPDPKKSQFTEIKVRDDPTDPTVVTSYNLHTVGPGKKVKSLRKKVASKFSRQDSSSTADFDLFILGRLLDDSDSINDIIYEYGKLPISVKLRKSDPAISESSENEDGHFHIVFSKGSSRFDETSIDCSPDEVLITIFKKTEWPFPKTFRFDGDEIDPSETLETLEIENGFKIEIVY